MSSLSKKRIFLAILYLELSLHLIQAEDHGVRGHLFSIQEQDLLEYLKHKLSALSAKDTQLFEEKIQQQYLNMAKEPKGIEIGESKEQRIYYFDPCITASKDIYDHQGSVIVSKGSRFNPLSVGSLPQDLLFIDGSNEFHVKWAKEQGASTRWITVKGKPLELEEQEERPIYFDQFGFLTTKLDIKNIPAKVTQENNQLKIEEIPL
jgi:conjugal transfer pilus assembly protein TraW